MGPRRAGALPGIRHVQQRMSIASGASSWGRDVLRYTLIPLVLMFTLPAATITVWLIIRYFDGSVNVFVVEASFGEVLRRWPWPTVTALQVIAAWLVFQTILLVSVPGRHHFGPATPPGDRAIALRISSTESGRSS